MRPSHAIARLVRLTAWAAIVVGIAVGSLAVVVAGLFAWAATVHWYIEADERGLW